MRRRAGARPRRRTATRPCSSAWSRTRTVEARHTSRCRATSRRPGVPPTRVRREVRLADGRRGRRRATRCSRRLFADGERVDVIGTSRGKGFQGVVKRHHFRGGAATHGSMFHRAPGSIGASSFPSRVVKGMRAAGRMGGDRVTIQQPEGAARRRREQPADRRGAVPGAPAATSSIRKAVTAEEASRPAQVEKPQERREGREPGAAEAETDAGRELRQLTSSTAQNEKVGVGRRSRRRVRRRA